MTAFVYHEIACNGTGCTRAYNDAGTKAQVRARAREAGWAVGLHRGTDYCPDCRKRLR